MSPSTASARMSARPVRIEMKKCHSRSPMSPGETARPPSRSSVGPGSARPIVRTVSVIGASPQEPSGANRPDSRPNVFVIIRKPTTTSIAPVTYETAVWWSRSQPSRWLTAVAPDRHEDERDGESGRVGDQQDGALEHARADRRQADDPAEDRPDARRPAGGEDDAEQRRPAVARPDRCRLTEAHRGSAHRADREMDLAIEHADVDDARDVEAHEDEDRAAELAEDPDVVAQDVADEADRRPQRDEHEREADDEGQGLAEGRASTGVARLGVRPDHVADVGGHEREAAWRGERHDARHEGDERSRRRCPLSSSSLPACGRRMGPRWACRGGARGRGGSATRRDGCRARRR